MADHRDKHERIPSWNNDPDSFNEFEERALWYEKGLNDRDRRQAVARIVGTLSGPTWKLIQDLSKEDQTKLNTLGVATLTRYLRDSLIEVGIPEVGKRFGEYLGRFHRKKGDTMRQFIQAHRHLQNKVEVALEKIEKKIREKFDYRGQLRTLVQTLKARETPRTTPAPSVLSVAEDGQEQGVQAQEATWEPLDEEAPPETDPWTQWNQSRSWWSWWGSNAWWDSGVPEAPEQVVKFEPQPFQSLREKAWAAIQNIAKRLSIKNEKDPDLEIMITMLEKHRDRLFPSTFTGWLMLQRSGLDATERSSILGRTNDSLEQQDVETALLALWMDADLRDRDNKKGVVIQRGFLAEAEDDTTAEHAHVAQQHESDDSYEDTASTATDDSDCDDAVFHIHADKDGFDPNDISDDDTRDEYEKNFAVVNSEVKNINKSRRSLAAARAMMRRIKTERGFYKPSSGDRQRTYYQHDRKKQHQSRRDQRPRSSGSRSFRPRGTRDQSRSLAAAPSHAMAAVDDIKCFGCGAPGHLKRDCPNAGKRPRRPQTSSLAVAFPLIHITDVTSEKEEEEKEKKVEEPEDVRDLRPRWRLDLDNKWYKLADSENPDDRKALTELLKQGKMRSHKEDANGKDEFYQRINYMKPEHQLEVVQNNIRVLRWEQRRRDFRRSPDKPTSATICLSSDQGSDPGRPEGIDMNLDNALDTWRDKCGSCKGTCRYCEETCNLWHQHEGSKFAKERPVSQYHLCRTHTRLGDDERKSIIGLAEDVLQVDTKKEADDDRKGRIVQSSPARGRSRTRSSRSQR